MSNEITKPAGVPALLKQQGIRERIEDLLGKRASSFCSTVIQMSSQGLLSECEPRSILGAAITAATLDLSISPVLGLAYAVPYKNRKQGIYVAQFQMGYKGFIQLAQRSGKVARINEFIVGAGQLKSYNPMTGEIEVDWNVEPKEGDKPDGYGCYLELINGFKKTVYWPYDKVYAHAMRFSQAFKAGRDCPWKSDFDAMGLKTVIKQLLSKYAPLSIEMERAIESDQGIIDAETGKIDYEDNPEDGLQVEAPALDVDLDDIDAGEEPEGEK